MLVATTKCFKFALLATGGGRRVDLSIEDRILKFHPAAEVRRAVVGYTHEDSDQYFVMFNATVRTGRDGHRELALVRLIAPCVSQYVLFDAGQIPDSAWALHSAFAKLPAT